MPTVIDRFCFRQNKKYNDKILEVLFGAKLFISDKFDEIEFVFCIIKIYVKRIFCSL